MSLVRAGIQAEAYDREYENKDLLRRIADYFRPHARTLIGIALGVSGVSLLGALTPLLIARGVGLLDTIRTGDGAANERLILLLTGGIVLLGVLVWAANWVQRRLAAMLIADVVLDMRRDAFQAAMNHDLSFYDRYQSSRIVSRITSDTEEFGRTAALITELIGQILLVLILLIVLFSLEWRLALLVLLLAPVAFIVAISFQNMARRITRQSQRAVAEVNTSIQEAVTGISVAKNFRREQDIYDEFLGVNQQSYTIHVQRGWVLSLLFPTMNLFSGFGIALLLYVGGLTVQQAWIGGGAWYLFMTSVDRFWFPMINLSAFWSQFQAALSATERVFALIDAKPVVQQSDNRSVPRLQGAIRFEGITFRYAEEKDRVLQDFNLLIQPGESVALVGHTGAGKSSIVKLVTRFYEFQAGRLTVDDQDIRSLDLQAYRRQLGIVSQSPFLFSGSVADNIRYATPAMSDAQVEAIVRQVGRGEWMETLPDGLRTQVGERGARLSMGQRQLVALARMLAQDPTIFILDEATASVDPFTEAQIQQALDLILRNRTSIIIAHRLSTVKAADRILVLDRGRIIEEGSHDQLLSQAGHYAELYNTYFRHQSLEFINTPPETRRMVLGTV